MLTAASLLTGAQSFLLNLGQPNICQQCDQSNVDILSTHDVCENSSNWHANVFHESYNEPAIDHAENCNGTCFSAHQSKTLIYRFSDKL
jgi:hypothetical protein